MPPRGVRFNAASRERYRAWSSVHWFVQLALLPLGVFGAWWLIAAAGSAWAGWGAEAGAEVVRSPRDLTILLPAILLGSAAALLLSEAIFRLVMLRSYAEYRDAVSALNETDVQRVGRLLAISSLVIGLPLAALSIDRYVVVGPRSIVSSGYLSLGSKTRPTASVKALVWGSAARTPELVVRFQDNAEVWLFVGGAFPEAQRQDIAAKLSTWTGKRLNPP